MTMMTPPPIDDQEDDEMLVPNSEIAVGPQPMEVAQTETATAGENQQVEDPPTSRFTWKFENFSRLNTKKLYSEVFVVGGFKWRVLIFPQGNNVDHLSMYLDVANSANLPYCWSIYVLFSLSVVNQMHSKYTVRKDTQHQFNARESEWGFTSFMSLGDLYDPTRGYLMNDACVVEAEVTVRKVVDYWTYDSKKETGYVGLQNQGATSFMNSLLQFLYHIPYFRKAVYHMPTTENDVPSSSIPLALQILFYKLQYSDSRVATIELTKSFGWNPFNLCIQHDVQEFNRVLCEKLEDKMKGTVVEGTIQQLFEGHHMNYIECINVDYKSTRKESFYDLQLDVKGCKDVYDSFDKYVEVQRLEADNKYHAEQYGLQVAKKGVLFIDFPPVLQLQLKRFEYDFQQDTRVKINDLYKFPLQLDLDRDNGKYLSPDADRSVRNLYTLHCVLVHRGGVHCGHYYAFIRPTLSDQWFKFDDARVTKEDVKRALEEQYGGEEEANPWLNNTPFKFTKYSNAYMLVYIRESDKDKIICNVDEKDIAEHLRIRWKKEQEKEEQKKKEKAEAHLYTIIKVARNEDLAEQIGRDIYFDLVDHDKVRSFHIQKQIPFNQFKEEVAKEFGIPVQFQRFWLWAKRQNHTYRPNRPLTPQEEAQSVGQLREVSNKAHNAELRLFLEVELGPDAPPLPPPDKTKEDILLFFKLYDPLKEELRYVGRLFVKALGKPSDILTKLNEMAGFPPNEEIELYEEIKFDPSVMCERIDKKFTFRSSELQDGDIICYQKSPLESDNQYCYPDVPSFLEYVHNRQKRKKIIAEEPEEEDNQENLAYFFSRKSPKSRHPSAASEAIRTTDVPRKRQKLRKRLVDAGTSNEEEASPQDKTPEEQRAKVTEEEPSGSVQRNEDQGMRAESSMSVDLPSEPESREGPNSAPSTFTSEPAPAPSSLSSVNASTPQSIKDRLPQRLASLTSQQVKKLLAEARASGQQELYACLTSLFGLLEEFEFAAKHPPSDVQTQLIKAREATELYNKQREELVASQAAIKLEAAQLKDALVKAEGRVVELEHALLTLAPPDPHAVDGLQLESDRQEAISKRIRGRLIQLEAEYESFLNGLH